MQSVPWLKLPEQNQAQSAGQESNDTETRCCLLRARNFPGRTRPSQQGRKATARKPDAVCSVPVASRAAEKLLNNAEQESNDTETRCCLLRARNFPGRTRSSQQDRKATARKPDAVCSVPVASRAAEKLLNNAETCCYPPSELQRQLKGTGDRVRRLMSSSSGSCNEHGSQEFLPHDTEHTSRICPTGAG
jgi:hypothetical protein